MQDQFIGRDYFPGLVAGDSEILAIDGARYLAEKSGVTLSSAVWSSAPMGVVFSEQSDTTAKSTALATIPDKPQKSYEIRCKMTFSDGAVRTYCAPLRIGCD